MKEVTEQDVALRVEEGIMAHEKRSLNRAAAAWPQFVLSLLATFMFGATLYLLLFEPFEIPSSNKDVVIFLVGQLAAFTGMGFQFFLGSSKGSKEKTLLEIERKNPNA